MSEPSTLATRNSLWSQPCSYHSNTTSLPSGDQSAFQAIAFGGTLNNSVDAPPVAGTTHKDKPHGRSARWLNKTCAPSGENLGGPTAGRSGVRRRVASPPASTTNSAPVTGLPLPSAATTWT